MPYTAAPSIFDKPLAEKAARRGQDADECLRAAFVNIDKLRAMRTLSGTAEPRDLVHYIKAARMNLFQALSQYEMMITPPELRYLAHETINARPAEEEHDEHRLVASQVL